MADYIIEGFRGLDQSVCELMSPPGVSHDELNMCTDGGILSVTKGFERLISAPVPGSGTQRIFAAMFRDGGAGVPVAISNGVIYAYTSGSWRSLYEIDGAAAIHSFCFLQTQIGTDNYLLIADGSHRILKFDGSAVTPFGSEEGCSDIPCAYMTMYRGRLFAAGDNNYPNRLYYSQLPGDDRSIEDWSYYPASPLVEGGHIEIDSASGDGITGICSLSNQLIIFKKYSVYRLIGDRPGNFTVERVLGGCVNPVATQAACCADTLFYLTQRGLYYFNGAEARPMPDIDAVKTLMNGANITESSLAAVGQKLYFTVRKGGLKLVEYDTERGRYLVFGGFDCHCVFENEGKLLLVSGGRRLCKWGCGQSFDGEKINAYWRTPATALGDRAAIKTLRELYLTGSGDVIAETVTGGVSSKSRVRLTGTEVAELPLAGEGRTLSVRLSNADGGAFELEGGLQLAMGVRKRTE